MSTPNQHLDLPRSWLMFGCGIAVYTMAVLQRSSFGVAGLVASSRFETGASIVSLFVVVQLLTYALMQVPAGLLADRFGTRLVVGAGAVIMGLGQISLAWADSLPPAVVARVMTGAGDAFTFTCLVKLLPAWFSSKRVPLLVQILSMCGQGGQLLSAIPFATLLRTRGWTPAFSTLSGICAVTAVFAWLALRNRPDGAPAQTLNADQTGVWHTVTAVWREPATRLGFCLHALGGYPPLVFAMMWGYPFLEQGVGLGAAKISALFAIMVSAGIAFGLLIGWLTPRHPLRLSNFTLVVGSVNIAALVLVLAFPRPPYWALVVWVLALSTCTAGSNIGLEVARTRNLTSRIGTATGVVVMGAFTFGVASMWLIGLVLDLVGSWSMTAWRLAFSTQLVLFAIAWGGVYSERPKVRRSMAGEGVVVPPWPDAIGRELRRWQQRLHHRGRP